MKNYFFSTFIGLVISITIYGQNQTEKYDIKWGNEIEASRRQTLSGIIGSDQSGFYALKTKHGMFFGLSTELTIEKYDNNANLLKSVELTLTDEPKKRSYEDIIKVNDKYYLFTSFTDSKTKLNSLYVQTIDMASLTPNNDKKKVADFDYSESSWKRNRGDFLTTTSKDDSKVLAFYKLPFDRGEKKRIGFSVLDNSMNKIWSRDLALPYNDELCDIERIRVDNEGKVYVQCTVYKEKRRAKRHGEPNYEYVLLCYKNGSEKPDDYKISLQGKFLADMQFSVRNSKDIICAGFYSEKGTFSIKGAFYLTIDGSSKEIIKQSYKEFSIDALVENLTERQKKKVERKLEKGKEVELYEYDLDNIIMREDGGALLYGEQYFVNAVTTTQTGPNGVITTITNYYYNYNDIIIVSVNPGGDIEWVTKIPKRQVTVNDNGFYSSYYNFLRNDKIYFLFNDNPQNLLEKTNDSKKYKNFSGGKNSVVVLAELDYNGNYTKDALFKSADAEVIIRPKVCSEISKDEVVIFGQRRKTQRFAKIIFR
ncbi:MAG TPA: hypothetical protein DIW31_04120 [Bacteroidales bacterium]|nr:hypothetical protein [Bacteroidales bacterium]